MKKKLTISQKTLNLWAIILIIWSIYRYNFRLPEWFDELIAKPLIFVLPVYLFIKKIEQKSFFQAIYFDKKKVLSDLIQAFLILLVFFLSAFTANFLKNHSLALKISQFNLQQVIVSFILALATGFSEEVLSRGFVLKRLYQDSKNILSACFFVSILFFFLHVPILFTNVKIVGNMLLIIMLTDISLSFALSLIFLYRKSLLLPILIHAFYNLTIILFI